MVSMRLRLLVSLGLMVLAGLAAPLRAETAAKRCSGLLTQKRVAIVDAYSAGTNIAPRLLAKGWEVVHVASTDKLLPSYMASHRPGDFAHRIDYRGDLAATAARLRELGVVAVLPGSEPGVELADQLSVALGTRNNGLELSAARRDKYLMHERLKEMGIPSLRHLKSRDLDEVLRWTREQNEGNFPVVLKPPKGAGTEGVFICENEEQVRAAFRALAGSLIGATGVLSEDVLVQEFLKGDEYVVDLMSLDGRSIVTDLWRYHKTPTRRPEGGLSNIYDFDELLDFDDPRAKVLVDYALRVTDALGIRNGPAHMEVMMTERGPVLVEVGARLIGGGTVNAVGAGTGTHPVDLMVEVYTDPQTFRARLDSGFRVQRRKATWVVQFISKQEGIIDALPYVDEIRAMPSLFKLDLHLKPGDRIVRTIDLMTTPGQVILIHEDPAVVARDHARLRELEASGDFYRLRR